MAIQFISNPRLLARWGIDRTTSYRWRKSGYLPLPDVVFNNRPMWKLETIEAFERKHGIKPS